jgi:hypothetical protein
MRTIIRSMNKQELWGNTGNVETFGKSFFSKESIILWTLKTYKNNRIRYQKLFTNPSYRHINFVRVTSPQIAKSLINQLCK